MASCDSAISAIVNLWGEYGEIAKRLGCTAAGVAVGVATSNPQAALMTIQQCLERADKIEDAIRTAESAFSEVIGRTSGLTIGPRLLRLDTWESGTIVGTTERLFLTAAPMSRNSATFLLHEQGGKGKVSVTVCAFTADRDHRKLVDFVVNESEAEKDDKDQKFSIRLSGVEGRWISVHLDGKSVANTFKYKLKLDA
jgi:hypothetical protein